MEDAGDGERRWRMRKMEKGENQCEKDGRKGEMTHVKKRKKRKEE